MPELTGLQALLERRRIEKQEFPLDSLLLFYFRSPRTLYLSHFEGFKLLKEWLSPISRSKFQPMEIPTCLCTYECQQLGVILGEHPSVIYQELLKLWKHSLSTLSESET